MNANGTVVQPDARDIAMGNRTTELGRLRHHVEQGRRHALKAAGQADRLGATELHRRLMLVLTTLDDGYAAITEAHQVGSGVDEQLESIDTDQKLRDLCDFIGTVFHEFPTPEAARRVRSRAAAITEELGR